MDLQRVILISIITLGLVGFAALIFMLPGNFADPQLKRQSNMIGQTVLKALSDTDFDPKKCEYTIDQTNVANILPTLQPLLSNMDRHKLLVTIKPITVDGKDAIAINVNVWHPEMGALNFSGIKSSNRLSTHTAQHYYF